MYLCKLKHIARVSVSRETRKSPKEFSVISNQKLYTFYRMYLMPNFSHLRKHHVPTFSAKLQRLFAEKDMIAFWDLILCFIFSLLTSNLCA